MKRSLINAYRHQEADNITIKVGNFQEVEQHLEQKYDVITLIGVFEYANIGYSIGACICTFMRTVKGFPFQSYW